MSTAKKNNKQIIWVVLTMLFYSFCTSTAHAKDPMNVWVINTQSQADHYAKWLKNPPSSSTAHHQAYVLRSFIYTCSLLRAYSPNDWCLSTHSNRRWLNYARKHGFKRAIDGYYATYRGNLRFPVDLLK